jgi:alpha-D-ribose 1-methylphosphonate 5-triphosphate synthase subunit PhnL
MDAQARTALVHAITRLRDQGSAIVLATHDARLRDALADRVIDIANLTLTENRPETKVASR